MGVNSFDVPSCLALCVQDYLLAVARFAWQCFQCGVHLQHYL